MDVTEQKDELTSRTNGVLLEPDSFEEQRLLARMMEVFKSGKGKIVIITADNRMTWSPVKPAKKQ